MAEILHDHGLRAGATRDLEGALGGAGIIVLASEQIERAAARVDLVELARDVAIDHVEVQVALEHAGPALHVVPQRFPAAFLRRGRCNQARHDAGRDLAAVHVGPMQPAHIVVWVDLGEDSSPMMARNLSGCSCARCSTMRPPIEQPITTGLSSSSADETSRTMRT